MDTRFKRASYSYEPYLLNIDHFADPEKEFSAHFLGEEPEAHPEPPFYGFMWPAAEALGRYVWQRRDSLLKGASVLEIGCGLGLPSLVCALAGAEVTALDHHPEALPLLQRNFDLNQLCLKAFEVGSFTNPKLELGTFPLIIGSDILYDAAQHPNLFAFLLRHLKPGGKALITDPGRYPSAAFVSLIQDKLLFEKESLPHPKGEHSIDLYIMTKK